MRRRLRRVHHWILWVCVLSGSFGCEWKPPRRPVSTLSDHPISTEKIAQSSADDQLESPESSKRPSLNQEIAKKVPRVEETVDEATVNSKAESQTLKPENQAPSEKTVEISDRLTVSSDHPVAHTSQGDFEEAIDVQDLVSQDEIAEIDPDGPPLIHLKELVIAEAVRNRQPHKPKRLFSTQDQKVTLFIRVRNFERPQKIRIHWIYGDQIVQSDRVKVGISPRWRTWTTLNLQRQAPKTGLWKIEVYSASERRLLGRALFKVE